MLHPLEPAAAAAQQIEQLKLESFVGPKSKIVPILLAHWSRRLFSWFSSWFFGPRVVVSWERCLSGGSFLVLDSCGGKRVWIRTDKK